MIKKYFLPILIVLILIFTSCFGQRNRRTAIIPIPDMEFFDFTLHVSMDDIIETQGSAAGTGGYGTRMPEWLRVYINDGIAEVENLPAYNGKYVFIGMSEGVNFTAMRRWADNFSPVRDTIMLAARRVENKLVSSASLYPDDEYGAFFETIIKNAYSTVYPGAVKEDTYWIKTRISNEEDPAEIYVFFVLITVNKTEMQDVIISMISRSMHSSSFSSGQRNAVDRLQKNFFEGF